MMKVLSVWPRILLAVGLCAVVGASALADPIIVGAKVAKILNIRSPGDASFVVLTEGGSGVCSGQWLYFYPTGASNPEAQKRAYAAVLMAMSTGMRVDIESSDSSCSNAYALFVYP